MVEAIEKIKLSVIIPCYNQGQFLNETLSSIFYQTYRDWECIIVNDGSTDNTEVVAKTWLAKDARFKYTYQRNKGLSSARNKGLDLANGNYIQFLDADDCLHRDKLKLSLDLITNKSVDIVISNYNHFITLDKLQPPYSNLNQELFNLQTVLYQWDAGFSIPIHCGFFKSNLFANFRFPEHLKAKEDWVMWVSLFYEEQNKAFFLDKPLALYRSNNSSMTKTKSLHDDQIKAYTYLKGLLSEDEFYKLSTTLISRYYKSEEEIKKRLRKVKASRPYQTGLMIKKILKKIGLLKISRRIFPILLKFKAKH